MSAGFPENLDPSLVDNYTRDGYVYDLYDGDTVYYHAALGYDVWAAFQTGRLLNINTPEIRPLKTRKKGKASKTYLQELMDKYALNRFDENSLRIGKLFRMQSHRGENKWFRHVPGAQKGKYGRWLVTLIGADDDGHPINLNQIMLDDGFASPTPDWG